MIKKETVENPAVRGSCPLCGEDVEMPEGCVAKRCPKCREIIERKRLVTR